MDDLTLLQLRTPKNQSNDIIQKQSTSPITYLTQGENESLNENEIINDLSFDVFILYFIFFFNLIRKFLKKIFRDLKIKNKN